MQKKQVDLRRYRPNKALEPSKETKKTKRAFNGESNLTDLLGTDIFGEMADPFGNGGKVPNARPSKTVYSNQPSKPVLNRQSSKANRFEKYHLGFSKSLVKRALPSSRH